MKHKKKNNMFLLVLAFALVMVLVYFISQPTLEGMDGIEKKKKEIEEEKKNDEKKNIKEGMIPIKCLSGEKWNGQKCIKGT
jgi:hypothetical protein